MRSGSSLVRISPESMGALSDRIAVGKQLHPATQQGDSGRDVMPLAIRERPRGGQVRVRARRVGEGRGEAGTGCVGPQVDSVVAVLVALELGHQRLPAARVRAEPEPKRDGDLLGEVECRRVRHAQHGLAVERERGAMAALDPLGILDGPIVPVTGRIPSNCARASVEPPGRDGPRRGHDAGNPQPPSFRPDELGPVPLPMGRCLWVQRRGILAERPEDGREAATPPRDECIYGAANEVKSLPEMSGGAPPGPCPRSATWRGQGMVAPGSVPFPLPELDAPATADRRGGKQEGLLAARDSQWPQRAARQSPPCLREAVGNRSAAGRKRQNLTKQEQKRPFSTWPLEAESL